MAAAAANRMYDLLHAELPYHDGTFSSWAKEPVDANGVLTHAYHYREGVNVWVSPADASPDDKFLTDPAAPAYPRGGEHGDEA
ncbi:MAG: hypothetical protein ACXWYG_03910 [Aeromicrobium sp.]